MNKRKPAKSTRKRVPALDKLQLEAALVRLKESGASKGAIAQVEAILKAAANPHGENVEVVIKTLPKARRSNVEKSARTLSRLTGGVVKRGSAALMEMSDDEFDKLVDEANGT